MSSTVAKWKARDFLVVILLLQSIIYATVLFDVPVARQAIGFLYLTFIPGIVILKLLKLDKQLDGLETILFSVGLSVAFLMLAGLLVNEFGFLLGISEPLSLMPLMIIFNSLILIGGVLVYLRSEDGKLFGAEALGLSPLALLLPILPILSVLGAMWVNAYENNVILLFMIIAISLLFVIAVISKKLLPPKLYPLVILVIAISLLYHSSLISNYIWGADIHMEYFIFKTTENNAHWSSVFMYPWDTVYGRINSMLSVTILPTIYSSLLNMDATWVLKILYPIIFSFVPLALYKLWQKNIGAKRAFMAAFLFMAMSTFYTEMLGLNRQMIAELFFILLLLVVLSKEMKPFNRITCFMIFSVALITSHYALAEIFLLFISLVWISMVAMKRPSRNVTVTLVVFFFVAMFSWYLYTSSSAVFDSLVSFGNSVYDQLGGFFNPASRGQTVLRGLGLEAPSTIWNMFSRAFAYLTEFLIFVGFVGLITKRMNNYFEKEYFVFTVMAIAFLGALIAVPGLAGMLNMTRFYHILLFFLAPLCVLGGEVLAKLVSRQRTELWASVLLLIVLVPYFLFQTGFVYEITGTQSWSVPLSKYRMDRSILMGTYAYVNGWQASGAIWLNGYVDAQSVQVYADWSAHELGSYAMVRYVQYLSNTTEVPPYGIVYLSYLNIVEGIILGAYIFNTTELSFINDMNKVYVNGGCEIYIPYPN